MHIFVFPVGAGVDRLNRLVSALVMQLTLML